MSDNISTPEQKKEGKFLFLTTRHLLLFLLIIGVIGCAQYFVVGIIGVIRGCSIQSDLPLCVAFISMFTILMICAVRNKSLARWKQNVLNVIALSPIVCYSLIIIQQSTNSANGTEYYLKGQYAESIQYYRKATETWYLPFVYTSEGSSLIFMADAYCQLGNFDKAREIYQLIQQRYPTYFGASAAKSINSLDSGLQKVKEYEALPADKKNDVYVLYDLARIYEFDLHCKAKALDIYMKILSLPVADKSKESAKESIERLAIKENN
jgi:pentatricopeptide repeat protein